MTTTGLRPIPALLACLALLTASPSPAAVSKVEAERASRNWLAVVAASPNRWNGCADPEIASVEPLVREGRLLGWQFVVSPTGYVVVPARRELAPVHACSETSTWSDGETNPFLPVILESLDVRFQELTALDDDEAAGRIRTDRPPLHPAWPDFERDPDAVRLEESAVALDDDQEGPLLETRWHQDLPFNGRCPESGGRRTYVGCTALATAQLMRYHEWPPFGFGVTGYEWDGDDCVPETVGGWLQADLADPYDWDDMPDVVDSDTEQGEIDAVAHLCYDVAVACRMDFSICGSAASAAMARGALINDFHYLAGSEVVRFRYTDAAWFEEVRGQIDRDLPVIYSTAIHTMVCDGWREISGLQQIHMNYGWGGASDDWTTLDAIETSLNPYAERMILDVEPDESVDFDLELLRFDVEEIAEGMELNWEVPVSGMLAEFIVNRSGGGPHGCVPLPLIDVPLSGAVVYDYVDDTVDSGDYDYWLQAFVPVIGEVWYGPVRVTVTVGVDDAPPSTRLLDPAPNPANPRTTVGFALGETAHVSLRVLDPRGRRVRTLVDGALPAGDHERTWDGRDEGGRAAPSGVYVVCLETGGVRETRKLLLAR